MESDFSEILFPYKTPIKIDESTDERNLHMAKVFLEKEGKPYLLISRKCLDHSEKISLIQSFYLHYQFEHRAIMHINRLSVSPNNSIEALYKYPENGRLSDFIGFAHENKPKVKANILTPTNKSIIAYGLAHALRYIHQSGYQFCDVNAKNVYLDSTFHPYLTNFYAIKKINDNTNESLKISSIQAKMDVLSYAIIYAALIEPISFDPPIQSSKEFVHNLTNRKRPTCVAATNKQRKILNKMWDYVPRDRINFDQIVDYFDSGELLFPETDINEFEEYKIKVNTFDKSKLTPFSTPIKSQYSSASSSAFSSAFTSPSKSRSPSPKPSPSIIKKIASDVLDVIDDE